MASRTLVGTLGTAYHKSGFLLLWRVPLRFGTRRRSALVAEPVLPFTTGGDCQARAESGYDLRHVQLVNTAMATEDGSSYSWYGYGARQSQETVSASAQGAPAAAAATASDLSGGAPEFVPASQRETTPGDGSGDYDAEWGSSSWAHWNGSSQQLQRSFYGHGVGAGQRPAHTQEHEAGAGPRPARTREWTGAGPRPARTTSRWSGYNNDWWYENDWSWDNTWHGGKWRSFDNDNNKDKDNVKIAVPEFDGKITMRSYRKKVALFQQLSRATPLRQAMLLLSYLKDDRAAEHCEVLEANDFQALKDAENPVEST